MDSVIQAWIGAVGAGTFYLPFTIVILVGFYSALFDEFI